MFPKINTNLTTISEKASGSEELKPLGKIYKFDFNIGQHILIDGKFVECTIVEGIAQWIEKVLRTEMGKYKIYTIDEAENFGISAYKYIGSKGLPSGYVMSELKREITEQLLNHRYIQYIEDYDAERERRGIHVSFTAILKTGEIIEKEVVINGL